MSWNFVLAKPIWLSKCCPTGRIGRFSALRCATQLRCLATKTYDSYTWPDSVAPSTNVTPEPLTYHAGWLPKVKKAVPVSDRVLRSHVAKKKFRGLTVTPLNGLDFSS